MLSAVLALAISASGLWYVDLWQDLSVSFQSSSWLPFCLQYPSKATRSMWNLPIKGLMPRRFYWSCDYSIPETVHSSVEIHPNFEVLFFLPTRSHPSIFIYPPLNYRDREWVYLPSWQLCSGRRKWRMIMLIFWASTMKFNVRSLSRARVSLLRITWKYNQWKNSFGQHQR